MDSMEKSFERIVDSLMFYDMMEGDHIKITTKSGSEYEFIYTNSMLVAKGQGNALENAFGNFRGAQVGKPFNFGGHRTNVIEQLVHIRPSTKEAINLPPEASFAVKTLIRLGMAGKDGIQLNEQEVRALRRLYGIAEFSPD